jgi:endonuclease-3
MVRSAKKPFNIDRAMSLIRETVKPYPKAAMFELAERGFSSLFEQLIGCIISIRTLDEVSLPAAVRLLGQAWQPSALAALSTMEIEQLIAPSTFHERKAAQIQAIARRVADEFGGELPCDEQVLLSFKGVGVKCAHLALGVGCGKPYISVDIHVHRVTNRWGYVSTSTPEKTMQALEEKLPGEYWVEINRMLVPFGKHICTGAQPRCSTCPVLDMCQQVGVTKHR